MTEFLQRRKEVKSSPFTRVWVTHQGSSTLTTGHPALSALREQCHSFPCVEERTKYQSVPSTSTAILKGMSVPTVQAEEHPKEVFNKADSRTANHNLAHLSRGGWASKAQSTQRLCAYVTKPRRLFSLSLPCPHFPPSLLSLPSFLFLEIEWEIQGIWSLSCQWEQKLENCIQRAHIM